MRGRVSLKYIFAEHSEKITQAQINRMHQVNESVVMSKAEKNNYVLNKEALITLLRDDGAHFHNDSLRVYDENYRVFFQVTDDYEIHINPNDEKPVEVLFWLKGINTSYKKKIEDLNLRESKNRQEISNLHSKIANLMHITKILNDDLKKVMQALHLPSSNLNKTINDTTSEYSSTPDNLGEVQTSARIFSTRSEPERLDLLPEVDLRKKNSVMRLVEEDSLIDSFNPRILDIAIVYSEPLVKKVGKTEESLGDPVDYEGECTKLLETLQEKKKKIDLIFEIATHDRLLSLVAKSPVILHIICHGEYNQEKMQFYLCFETDKGELKEFYSNDLAAILQSVELKIKLVFVNACHSEGVAQVFVDAGVPCVIAIQSKLKIADKVAQKFSHHFYNQIFDGKNIKDAFELAKLGAKSADTQTCCCAHSHKPTCDWYNNYAKKIGFRKAHQYHVPLCTECPKRHQHIHGNKCRWAGEFVMDFQLKHDYTNPDNPKEYLTCCCSPELPHDESLKFKKICQNQDVDKMILFPQKEPGKVTNKNPYSVIEQKFVVKRIYGRNRELFQLYDYLVNKDQRFVQLNGSDGVGKRTLVKQFANYLHERGHFRDKMSFIMMEQTPSISHFKSELFKEMPGTYNLKDFCEAIKKSKILFILEKCDLLLKNSRKEFIDTLKKISNSAKYVKFIIIKNQYENLNLDESKITIDDLSAVDAAEILINYAFENLQLDDRKPENLVQRRLFKELKHTQQRIWWISERLKRFETLDAIENDLLKNQNVNVSKEQTTDQDTMVMLQTIQSKSQLSYELALSLAIFPGGLSSYDMKQLADLNMIPQNWILLMKEQTQSQINNPDPKEAQAVEKNQIPTLNPDYQQLLSDNYYWITITKDSAKEFFYYQPAEFLHRFVNSKLRTETVTLSLYKFEYLVLVALSMITRLKELYAYHEKLIEYSSVASSGIWKLSEKNTFYVKHLKDKKFCSFIDEFKEGSNAFDLTAVQKMFAMHELNFKSLFDAETITTILQLEKNKSDQILDLIEIAWLAIPTLFKLVVPNQAEARDLALRALNLLDILENKTDPRLRLLRAKLRLFLISLYLFDKNDSTITIKTITAELENVSKAQKDIADSEVYSALGCYMTFAESFLYYKIRKGRYLQNETQDKRRHIKKKFEDILSLVKRAGELASDLGANYNIESAKIAILTSKVDLKNYSITRGVDHKVMEKIKAAISLFHTNRLKRLELSAIYQYAVVVLNLKKYHTSRSEGSQNSKLIDYLAYIKNYYLNKSALSIAKMIKFKQINDTTYEGKVKKLIEDINTEIRKQYYNVMILMRAAPIVEMQPRQQQPTHSKAEIESKSVGFPTRVASFYKRDLITTLNEKKKTLYLKFEPLTKANLIDSLKNGCRIMQINCHLIQNGCIVVEDSFGRAEQILYPDLKEMFLPKSTTNPTVFEGQMPSSPVLTSVTNNNIPSQATNNDRCLDLLLLGSKNDSATAKFFAEEIKIPHVVYFEFENKESDFRHKLYEDHCIDKFCQFFLDQIVEGKSVRDSFDRGYALMLDSLSMKFFESKDNEYVINIIGKGPILLPEKAKIHDEVLYGIRQFMLHDGHVEDISKVRYPTNIMKTILPYTGRNNDIYAVMKLLDPYKFPIVKLIGDPGIGKTDFALHIGRFLLTRDIFRDGIFYFPLKNMRGSDLVNTMKAVFGPKFQSNVKNFFRDKKMLLIFDDFDVFYTGGMEFPRWIFLTLRECQISILALVTTPRKKAGGTLSKKQLKEYESKQKLIEEDLSGAERTLKPMKDEEIAQLLISMVKLDKNMSIDFEKIKSSQGIKLAEGNPRTLINNLLEKKILIDRKPFEIHPAYFEIVNLDHVVSNSLVNLHQTVNVSKAETSKSFGVTNEHVKPSKGGNTTKASKGSQKFKEITRTKSSHPASSKRIAEDKKGGEKSGNNTIFNLTENRLDISPSKFVYTAKPERKSKGTESGNSGFEEQKAPLLMNESQEISMILNKQPSLQAIDKSPLQLEGKFQLDAPQSQKQDLSAEFEKKDNSISGEKSVGGNQSGSNALDNIEEQKSKDAEDILKDFSVDSDVDEFFSLYMNGLNTENISNLYFDSDDEKLLNEMDKGKDKEDETPVAIEEKRCFSEGENVNDEDDDDEDNDDDSAPSRAMKLRESFDKLPPKEMSIQGGSFVPKKMLRKNKIVSIKQKEEEEEKKKEKKSKNKESAMEKEAQKYLKNKKKNLTQRRIQAGNPHKRRATNSDDEF